MTSAWLPLPVSGRSFFFFFFLTCVLFFFPVSYRSVCFNSIFADYTSVWAHTWVRSESHTLTGWLHTGHTHTHTDNSKHVNLMMPARHSSQTLSASSQHSLEFCGLGRKVCSNWQGKFIYIALVREHGRVKALQRLRKTWKLWLVVILLCIRMFNDDQGLLLLTRGS